MLTVLLDNVVYAFGFLSNRFIVLNIISNNKATSTFVIGNSNNNSFVNDIK